MANLINLTPHPVTVLKGGTVIMTIPPSGQVLRLPEAAEYRGEVMGVEVVVKTLDPQAELPPRKRDTYYIVSLPAAQAIRRPDFLVPDDLVRDEEGRVIGCQRFAVIL